MNELLPYVKNELGPIVQTPPVPVWDDHIDKFLELTKEFECKNGENFEQAKSWTQTGVRLKGDIEESFKPYFDFLAQLKDPVTERQRRYINKVNERMNLVDSSAIAWKREQDRILEAEQEKKDQEELDRRIAEHEKLVAEAALIKQIAEEFNDPGLLEGIVEPPPVMPPRHSAVDSPYSYRKGKRSKPKLVAKIVNPDEVKRKFCGPDKSIINLTVANFAKSVVKPTDEQIVALAAEIGGVVIGWEG